MSSARRPNRPRRSGAAPHPAELCGSVRIASATLSRLPSAQVGRRQDSERRSRNSCELPRTAGSRGKTWRERSTPSCAKLQTVSEPPRTSMRWHSAFSPGVKKNTLNGSNPSLCALWGGARAVSANSSAIALLRPALRTGSKLQAPCHGLIQRRICLIQLRRQLRPRGPKLRDRCPHHRRDLRCRHPLVMEIYGKRTDRITWMLCTRQSARCST